MRSGRKGNVFHWARWAMSERFGKPNHSSRSTRADPECGRLGTESRDDRSHPGLCPLRSNVIRQRHGLHGRLRARGCLASDNVDAGLHLNLTTPFSASDRSSRVREQQQKLAHFLRANSLFQAIYHPVLAGAFDYVVKAQLDEYQRLYRKPSARIDGHHHMHLCANVQLQSSARGNHRPPQFLLRVGRETRNQPVLSAVARSTVS